MQHSEAGRVRIEGELARTHRGQERLALTQLRFDRRKSAEAQNGDQLEAADAEREIIGDRIIADDLQEAPANFPHEDDIDDEASRHESRAPSSDSDDGMRYSQESQMSVQQLAIVLSAGSEATNSGVQGAIGVHAHEPAGENASVGFPPVDVVGAGPKIESDMQLFLNMISQEELLIAELTKWTDDKVKIVAMLGGHRRKYRRERGRAVRKMVAEIYSAPPCE